MTDRDRLAADLQTGILGERNAMGLSANEALVVATRWADRLIERGWVQAPVPKRNAYWVLPSGRLRGWKGEDTDA